LITERVQAAASSGEQIAEYALPADSETRDGLEMQNCRFWRFLAACLVPC
jgi:hypothetical protein